jgi:hypothetical protein
MCVCYNKIWFCCRVDRRLRYSEKDWRVMHFEFI